MTSIAIFRHSDSQETFLAGQKVFSEGDIGKTMYFLIEGEVEIRIGKQLLETVCVDGIFGEMALVDRVSRSATAIAKTDCKVVAVDSKQFEFLVQQTPYFAIKVMQIMANRLRNTDRLLVTDESMSL